MKADRYGSPSEQIRERAGWISPAINTPPIPPGIVVTARMAMTHRRCANCAHCASGDTVRYRKPDPVCNKLMLSTRMNAVCDHFVHWESPLAPHLEPTS